MTDTQAFLFMALASLIQAGISWNIVRKYREARTRGSEALKHLYIELRQMDEYCSYAFPELEDATKHMRAYIDAMMGHEPHKRTSGISEFRRALLQKYTLEARQKKLLELKRDRAKFPGNW